MSQNPHPARSPEFLSRLHDGELSPAERAHFESHRAHCPECRHAASEFEAALSLFRSSRPAPAAPDLSARILRKLQSGRPRRSVFGPSFGIDLRWAGAFAAAVVAAIIGTSVVGRREAAERTVSSAAPIQVVVESRRSEPAGPEPPARREAAAPPSRPRPRAPLLKEETAGALASKGRTEEEVRPESQAAKTLPAAPAPSREEKRKLETAKERDASAPSDRLDSGARTMAKYAEAPPASPPSAAAAPERALARQAPASAVAPRTAERAGGEGANAVSADAVAPPLRIRLEALDGISAVPGVVGSEAAELPPQLRGSRWVLLIDGAGRVLQARRDSSGARHKDAPAELQNEASQPILALRFVPGDRPRRVLLRLE